MRLANKLERTAFFNLIVCNLCIFISKATMNLWRMQNLSDKQNSLQICVPYMKHYYRFLPQWQKQQPKKCPPKKLFVFPVLALQFEFFILWSSSFKRLTSGQTRKTINCSLLLLFCRCFLLCIFVFWLLANHA